MMVIICHFFAYFSASEVYLKTIGIFEIKMRKPRKKNSVLASNVIDGRFCAKQYKEISRKVVINGVFFSEDRSESKWRCL